MKQRVHNLCYLAITAIALKDLSDNDTIAFPQGAEIFNVSLEVEEAGDVGLTANLGIVGSEDLFANDINLSQKAHHTSSVKHTCKDKGAIKITLSQSATKGKVVIRALYFLPSTILAEY